MSDFTLNGKQLGQYQIVEQIGQGGMATVYKAFQPSINRYVAVKILPSQYALDPNFVKRFEHEAKAIAALEHPHILPVYDFGTQDGLTYMVMRYVPEGTLSNLMGKPIPYEWVVRLIGAMARALDYAHKQGVVHRDIKPSNILIDKNGEALLTDFGIAKMMETTGATQLTGAGSVLGTPAYMSPEQAKGQAVDGRSDIYSLGVVLYELLTGQQPFRADTPLAVVLKHVSEPLAPPRAVKADVPEPLERVVLKAMSKEPAQRYQSAGEMEQALYGALQEIEGTAKTVAVAPGSKQATLDVTNVVPPPSPPTPQKKSLMGPILIGGAIVLVLLCVGGAALLFMLAPGGNNGGTATLTARTPVNIGVAKTPTPTPVPPTATPTNTPTPPPATATVPAAKPTVSTNVIVPELPDLGKILFQDDFSDNGNDWFEGEQDDEYGLTKSEFVDGRYRISQEAKQGVFAWNGQDGRNFKDFMLSVEATPVEYTANFAYGVTVRENSKGDLYVFEIDTDGYYSVSVKVNNEWTTLVDWTKLKAIKSEGTNRLSVQAFGSTFMFLVNDQFATTIEDNTLTNGEIGLAIDLYNEGDKASVDFDNLQVLNLSDTQQEAMLDRPDSNGAENSGELLFEDTFDSDSKGWATGEFEDNYSVNTATVENGQYTLSVKDKDQAFVEKLLPSREFDDFILTVEATPGDAGQNYSYGVSFRENKDDIFYAFEIGNDGQYAVLLFDKEWKRLKDWSTSKAIKVGQTNKITIQAEGGHLTFYVNDEKLTTLENDTSLSGKIGLIIAMFEKETEATVHFDNLVIRKP